MKKIFALLLMAGSLSFYACNDNTGEVFDESIQNINIGEQINYSEVDFPDERCPHPNAGEQPKR